MKQLEVLKKRLKQRQVYRRADLKEWSTSVDRHLQQLVKKERWRSCQEGFTTCQSQVFLERRRQMKES